MKQEQHVESEVNMTHYTSIRGIDQRLSVNEIIVDYNKIEIISELGRGSFGVVYKGIWKSQNVAVKKLIGEKVNAEEFKREAELMKKLEPHPNVIRYLGVSLSPLCILTEFYDQGNLLILLRNTQATLSEFHAIHILKGIALGMSHLHRQNIVHRDLAARNILLSSNFDAVVSDFGFARMLGSPDDSGQTATEIGPIRWMAPESLQSKTYSAKSDVWSWAVIAYEVYTRGLEPYINSAPIVAATNVLQGKTLYNDLPSTCSSELKGLLAKCWSMDSNNRPTFDEVYANLKSMHPRHDLYL